jgi:hypothetical protein
MQNLGILRQLSLGELADDGKRRRERGEREKKIMPSLMATLLRWRTHSARTNCGRICGMNSNHRSKGIMTFSLLSPIYIVGGQTLNKE